MNEIIGEDLRLAVAMTLKELGSEMGVSKERIGQLVNRAIAKLRLATV